MTDAKEKISQRSIGFHSRQFEFLEKNPLFELDKFLREKLDEEIKRLNQFEFLRSKSFYEVKDE